MRKLAPELLRGSELPQVEHIVNEAFQFLTDQPKVMIRVASDLEAPLSDKVHLMASRVGYEGQVVLTGDPELELTDCRISWHAGAVERSLDETWMLIDEMVDRVLRGLPARDHPDPIPVEADTGDEEDAGDEESAGDEEIDPASEATTETEVADDDVVDQDLARPTNAQDGDTTTVGASSEDLAESASTDLDASEDVGEDIMPDSDRDESNQAETDHPEPDQPEARRALVPEE
jgi:flagellar assembly protein FliH